MTAARPHWWPVYVGVGSNLDDPAQQLENAFDALGRLPDTRVYRRSACYRSAPMGPPDQPDFLNAAVAMLTRLPAEQLLAHLQAIETAQGRSRTGARWGARTLDLDLLVYGSQVIDTPALTVPHPRIAERNFVLLPLNDIAPFLRIPGSASVASLAAAVSRREPRIERLGEA